MTWLDSGTNTVDARVIVFDEARLPIKVDILPEVGSQALVAAYQAALAVASEVRLDAVLQRIADLAREIVPSSYAALGVSDEAGRIVTFTTSGMTPDVRESLGPIPRGHGLLGALIHDGKPLLIPEIGDDPRSVGFPPNHPPMHSLLGVPILVGTRALGNLYLTERIGGGSYTREDLAALQVLAAHAATAIDRAELYRQVEATSRQAEEQRDQLRVILDNLPAGVLIQTAPDGHLEHANEAAIKIIRGHASLGGLLPAYGRDYRLIEVDGGPFEASQRPELRALRGEVIRNQQATLERADGSRLPLSIQATPMRDAAGVISRVVVVFQDVTGPREAEQLKDDFLSLVSHEFRTPLTSIHGGAHLLARQGDGLDPETRRELLEDVVTESGRLVRMLANMLSLAATMAGRTELRTEPVLLEPMIRRVSAEVAGRAPAFVFSTDLPDGLPPVEGDEDRLAQVLHNLYENAIKYSPDGGEIRTSATTDGVTVTLEVADDGMGIAPEHVPHIFERFRRPGADPTVRGMGLGLYLSRLLVKAQSGRIEARSPGVGRGAVFAVTLPVADGWHDDDADRLVDMSPK